MVALRCTMDTRTMPTLRSPYVLAVVKEPQERCGDCRVALLEWEIDYCRIYHGAAHWCQKHWPVRERPVLGPF